MSCSKFDHDCEWCSDAHRLTHNGRQGRRRFPSVVPRQRAGRAAVLQPRQGRPPARKHSTRAAAEPLGAAHAALPVLQEGPQADVLPEQGDMRAQYMRTQHRCSCQSQVASRSSTHWGAHACCNGTVRPSTWQPLPPPSCWCSERTTGSPGRGSEADACICIWQALSRVQLAQTLLKAAAAVCGAFAFWQVRRCS